MPAVVFHDRDLAPSFKKVQLCELVGQSVPQMVNTLSRPIILSAEVKTKSERPNSSRTSWLAVCPASLNVIRTCL